jgi:hypothetical protein
VTEFHTKMQRKSIVLRSTLKKNPLNSTYGHLVCECSFAKKIYLYHCVGERGCSVYESIQGRILDSDMFHNEGIF